MDQSAVSLLLQGHYINFCSLICECWGLQIKTIKLQKGAIAHSPTNARGESANSSVHSPSISLFFLSLIKIVYFAQEIDKLIVHLKVKKNITNEA